MQHLSHFPTSKTPILSRSLLFFLLILGVQASADAAPAKTLEGEIKIASLAVKHAPQLHTAQLEVQAATVESQVSTQRDNPSLAWDREHFPGSESEDSLVLSLPYDLSSTRKTAKLWGQANVAQARSSVLRLKSQVVSAALRDYYKLVAAQEMLSVQEQALQTLVEATRIVSLRRETGTAAGTDLYRIELEVELAASELRQSQSQVQLLSQSLSLRLGQDPQTSYKGSLAVASTTATPMGQSPSMQELKKALRFEERAQNSAQKRWLPTLSLSAGMKLGVAEQSQVGYIAGVAISLPLFTGSEAVRAKAGVRKQLSLSRIQGQQLQRAQGVQVAQASFSAARSEAARFKTATLTNMETLLRSTLVAYKEGQQSLTQLLDIHHLQAQIKRRQLRLRLSAKLAEILLRTSRGDYE